MGKKTRKREETFRDFSCPELRKRKKEEGDLSPFQISHPLSRGAIQMEKKGKETPHRVSNTSCEGDGKKKKERNRACKFFTSTNSKRIPPAKKKGVDRGEEKCLRNHYRPGSS